MSPSDRGTLLAHAEPAEEGMRPPRGVARLRGPGLALETHGSTGPFPWRAHWRWHLGALAGFLIYATFQSGLWRGDLGERLYVGDDVPMCAWLQTTVSANLLRHPWRPFDGNVYYPRPEPVVFANAQLGSALLVTPLRVFTGNPILLDNAGTLLTLASTSYALFLLAWWLWGDPGAALVPAIAVTYAAHQIHHLSHLNMLSIFGFPLLLLGIFQLFERPRVGAALLAGAAFAVQAMSCAYYGVASALLAPIAGLCGLARLHRRRGFGYAATAAVLAGLACWPYLMAFRSASLGEWTGGGDAGGGTGGISLVLPGDLVRSNAWLWSGVLPGRGDSAFAGFGVLLLAGWAVLRGFSSFYVRVLALVAGVFLLLALGQQLQLGGVVVTLPYGWLERGVPMLRAGRHPVSFVVVYLVALGTLAALGARMVGATRGRGRLALLLAVVVLEVLAPEPRREGRPAPPAVYAAVARLQPPGAIMELPFDSPDQQLWAASHGLQTAHGYLPHAPAEWLNLAQWFREDLKATPPRDVSDRRSLLFFRARYPVRYLIAHPGTRSSWIRNIEATPSVFERVLEVDGARVYHVSRGGRGRQLRRDFRSEDVTQGLDLVVSGPSGHTLVVYDGGVECARLALSPEPRSARLRLARRPSRTLVSLEMRPEPETEFELLGIEPAAGD